LVRFAPTLRWHDPTVRALGEAAQPFAGQISAGTPARKSVITMRADVLACWRAGEVRVVREPIRDELLAEPRA